jgi:flagellar biosynthesis protein FlhF
MELKTYRAKSMQEALALVRRDLGPRASVLHTREVRGGGWMRLLGGARLIEVVASTSVTVPSRFASRDKSVASSTSQADARPQVAVRSEPAVGGRMLPSAAPHGSEIVEAREPGVLDDRPAPAPRRELSDSMFRLFTDLIEADVNEAFARELLERVRGEAAHDGDDASRMRELLACGIENEIAVCGPIRPTPGRRHLVALVGPTGVGKTTTIAKLAANFRLREKQRVGLITVDTYRIAAVEQLRTYADIIDLPMEVVATPREMHQAIARLADCDLILMDTAGRSPRDEVKIQELKSMLTEAAPDEVHLVLSSVASAAGLAKTAQQFAAVGTTALLLTKLDEATSLGNLLPLIRGSRLPLSYLTHGQNVPDDIAPADPGRLARAMLGMESSIVK